MKQSAILTLVILSLVAGRGASAQPSVPDTNLAKATLVFVGTYTGAQAKGIYVFRLQSAGTEVFQNVTLAPLGLAAETPNPSFFELDAQRRLLFAVNEVTEFEGKPTGTLSAFSIAPDGKLALLNQRPSGGKRPCLFALDKGARHLLVSNCDGGNIAMFPIAADGRIGEAVQILKVPARCLAFDPESRFAFACDAATGRLLTFTFDADASKLTPAAAASTTLKSGDGPRQMVFRHDGRFAYVLNEGNSTVTVFGYDAATGGLTEVQNISTVPEYFDGENAAMDLRIHRTGRWLYASNSGHNSVVLFTIDKDKGTLTFVEEQGTGGKNPRFFGVEPSSKHLAISNVDSNTVLASRIDEGNGRLKPSGIFAEVPSPASIRFLPPIGAQQ